MKKLILIIIIGLLFTVNTSCVSTKEPTRELHVSKIEKYNGLSLNNLLGKLGKPIYQEHYKVKETIGEFRVNVFNSYPLSKPENHNVEIKELWWKDGDYTITVWFHLIKGEWVVMDTCRWHKSVQF